MSVRGLKKERIMLIASRQNANWFFFLFDSTFSLRSVYGMASSDRQRPSPKTHKHKCRCSHKHTKLQKSVFNIISFFREKNTWEEEEDSLVERKIQLKCILSFSFCFKYWFFITFRFDRRMTFEKFYFCCSQIFGLFVFVYWSTIF